MLITNHLNSMYIVEVYNWDGYKFFWFFCLLSVIRLFGHILAIQPSIRKRPMAATDDKKTDKNELPKETIVSLSGKVDISFDLSLRQGVDYSCDYRIATANGENGGFVRTPFWSLFNDRHTLQFYIVKAQSKKMWIGLVNRKCDPIAKLAEQAQPDDLDVPHRVPMNGAAAYYLSYHFKSNSQKRAEMKKKIHVTTGDIVTVDIHRQLVSWAVNGIHYFSASLPKDGRGNPFFRSVGAVGIFLRNEGDSVALVHYSKEVLKAT